jgi:hypothetical protein
MISARMGFAHPTREGEPMAKDPKDEDYRPPPPGPVAVARRALILSGVVCRAFIEDSTDESRRELVGDIHDWFDDLDLWPYLEAEEEEITQVELGKMPRQLRHRATWYSEGLAILAWALRRADFPPHNDQVEPTFVTEALDFLSPDAEELLKAPTLRPREELDAAREWFYDVHCTLRGFLNHSGDGHLATGIEQFVQTLGLDQAVVMVGNILAFESNPIDVVDRKRLQEWEQVIFERHRAVMWLEDSDEPYTEISVDT